MPAQRPAPSPALSTPSSRGGRYDHSASRASTRSAGRVRAEGAHIGTTKPEPPHRDDPSLCACADAGFYTRNCTAVPASHPTKKTPLGCGTYKCPNEICVKKFKNRRGRLIWDRRFAYFAAAVVHITLTVPVHLRHLVPDVRAFRRVAHRVAEAWFRETRGIAPENMIFGLGILHPAGDRNPSVWAPHENVFFVTRILTPKGLREVPAFVPVEALDLLRQMWAEALSKLVGVPIADAIAHVSVHTRPEKRRVALLHEARSFPGWRDRRLSRLTWLGGCGNRVWSVVRRALSIPDPIPHAERCAEPVASGTACGAPLVPFVSLTPEARAQVRAAEETTGTEKLEDWEREFDDHAQNDRRCRCESCRCAVGVIAPSATAWNKTWDAANFARHVALDLADPKLTEPGGVLHEHVHVVKAAYEALQDVDRRGLDVDQVIALREPFEAFIEVADQVGIAGDPKVRWRKRYQAYLDELHAGDVERTKSLTEFSITMDLRWVKPWDPTKGA